MNEPISFQLTAPIPSKKNHRLVLKSGANIPSKEFYRWFRANIGNVKELASRHGVFEGPVSVSIGVSFKDRR